MAGKLQKAAGGTPPATPTPAAGSARLSTDATRAMQSRVVEVDSPESSRVRVSQAPPSSKFVLAVHADRWSCGLDGLVLPEFKRIRIDAGIDGVRANARPDGTYGPPIWKHMVSAWEARGWQVILPNKGPGGVSYLRDTAVAGGVHHHMWCDRLYAGSAVVECDRASLNEWVWSLVADGTIQAPSVISLQRELRAAQKRALAAASKARLSAEHEQGAKDQAGVVAGLNKLITSLLGNAPAPEPVTPSGVANVEEV